MSDFDDEEEMDLPRFESHLAIPEEITGSSRMLLQQVDILQQTILWVHKKGTLGRRAWILAKKNEAQLAKFEKLYWMGIGFIAALNLVLKFLVK